MRAVIALSAFARRHASLLPRRVPCSHAAEAAGEHAIALAAPQSSATAPYRLARSFASVSTSPNDLVPVVTGAAPTGSAVVTASTAAFFRFGTVNHFRAGFTAGTGAPGSSATGINRSHSDNLRSATSITSSTAAAILKRHGRTRPAESPSPPQRFERARPDANSGGSTSKALWKSPAAKSRLSPSSTTTATISRLSALAST